MNSTALADALGSEVLDTWPYDSAFVPTHRQWHFERHGERGSRDLLARILYRNPNRQPFNQSVPQAPFVPQA